MVTGFTLLLKTSEKIGQNISNDGTEDLEYQAMKENDPQEMGNKVSHKIAPAYCFE